MLLFNHAEYINATNSPPHTLLHLHNVILAVIQIHHLLLFCLEKLISLMDRTDTGRGRIIQLYICNRHWFKLGLKLDAMKPDKMSRTGEPGRVGGGNKTEETTKTHCPTNKQPTPMKNKLKRTASPFQACQANQTD